MTIPAIVAGLLICASICAAHGQSSPFDPVSQDPPPQTGDFPAAMQVVPFESGGEKLRGVLYVAQGSGPHATVVIARGFGDYLGNLDLALALHRAGFNVLSFNYRGCWGNAGYFTLMNSLDDLKAAIEAIKAEPITKKARVDPHRLILLGYSLGGPIALRAASDFNVRAVTIIDGSDLRVLFPGLDTPEGLAKAATFFESSPAMRVKSGEAAAEELRAQWSYWNPLVSASALRDRDMLFVYASRANGREGVKYKLTDFLSGASRLSVVSLDTGHLFLDQRIALTRTVLAWLARLK